MPLVDLLDQWRHDPSVAPNIVAWRETPPTSPDWAPLPRELHPNLVSSLARRAIHRLYSHQAQSWERLASGENVVIVTGTASGKTLCYNLTVADCLLRQAASRALYLFPTKALAQDQRHELASLLADCGSDRGVATYDGDTPVQARAAIRERAAVVITNPDMVHAGILPHHTLWADLFRRLQYVVIDEIHTYRGVFGSHVANLLRRLKRVCAFYGSDPRYILTSATIGNPVALAENLVEAPVTLVDRDGSERGPRHFLMYNPPIVDRTLGIRRSVLQESVRLASDLREHQVQTIVFARARRTVELLLRHLQQSSSDRAPARIRGYRGGYLPDQRRQVERGLREGEVSVVVATSALELGIDIGGLGAAVMAGYPGTVAGAWQQAGRAGRGRAASVAVMVASATPLDQFLASHSGFFFGQSPERALINADNLLILLQHLRCAAFELPFSAGDSFGHVPPQDLAGFLDLLTQAGFLHHTGQRFFWMADQYPAQSVSLRSVSADTVLLVANGVTLGKVDLASAAWMVHPQAVYLHEARSFLVEDLDLPRRVAQLRQADPDYYTEPRIDTAVSLEEVLQTSACPGAEKAHGSVCVTTTVTGFRKVQWLTQQHLGDGDVTLPPSDLHTTAYWLALADDAVAGLRAQGLWTNDSNDYGPAWPAHRAAARARDLYRCQSCGLAEANAEHDVHHLQPFRTFASAQQANLLSNLVTLCPTCHRRAEAAVRVRSGLAGLAHVLGHLAPLFLMCDSSDLGVHSDPQSRLGNGRPAVILYDRVPAGIGFSQLLFDVHGDLVTSALNVVEACPCAEGCPACVGPAGENSLGGKAEAAAILRALQPSSP